MRERMRKKIIYFVLVLLSIACSETDKRAIVPKPNSIDIQNNNFQLSLLTTVKFYNKNEKRKNEFELQSYFIKRIEKYLLSKNRYLIGWDEILEGGLAPNATVMSWRGTEGGIKVAKENHDVIMSPNSHCYFDHYQALYNEPYAIGGFTPLEKVYSYNPIPKELTEQEAKHILGAQANLWTEYISTTDYAEYMLLPRLAALSEVIWTNQEQILVKGC